MTPGKMASQLCHASKNCLLLAERADPDLARLYQGPKFLGTQITLKAKNEAALRKAHDLAKEAGLITSLIEDEDHVIPGTAFDGNPIITALGIGPCTREQAHAITKRFEMVR